MFADQNDSNENKYSYIDTHCHLNYAPLKDNLPQIINKAKQAGVVQVVCIGTNLDKSFELQDINQQYPDFVKITLGHHPCQTDLTAEQVYEILSNQLQSNVQNIGMKIVGIGETGLDCTNPNLKQQTDIFHAHIEIASKHNLPIVVHSRNMDQELLESLRKYKDATGVLHCWTGQTETALEAVKLGWKISFSGILTFKKKVEYLQELASILPLESIVIETDSPYLAPEPYRGMPNDPSYVVEVAKKLAQIRNMNLADLQEALFKNSVQLFPGISCVK